MKKGDESCKLRVLIVNSRMNIYGGAEVLIVNLAKYMAKKGIENALLTTYISPEIAKDFIGTKIIIQQKHNIYGRAQDILALYEGVRKNFKYFDLINVHNYPAELSIFRCHKPVVWMCNEPFLYLSLGLNYSLFIKLRKWLMFTFEKFVVKRYISKAVVADKFNAERFRKIYGFKPEIIHYGIDYQLFTDGDGKKALENFNLYDSFIVLHVGMLTPFKNQLESIRTIEKLKDKIENVKLVFAGLGNDKYLLSLKKYIKKKKLEDIVVFTGHLDRMQLRDLYHACDVLLHPVKSQGGWLAPFEALCAGKPIVVSNEMSASDIIRKEKIGIVTDNFSEAIRKIYKNPDKYREVGKRGQEYVRKNLSWEKFGQNMVNLFCKLVER